MSAKQCILIIEKNGDIKKTMVKEIKRDELHKKCGLKTNDGFELLHTWSIDIEDGEYKIEIYGKKTGRVGNENKFELPPPVDSLLLYGSMAVLVSKDNEFVEIEEQDFQDIIETLMGGFEDIGDEDTISETSDMNDDDDLDNAKFTKNGYVKDGFVVNSDGDDEDDDEDDEELESEEEEDEIVNKKHKKHAAKKKNEDETKPAKKRTRQITAIKNYLEHLKMSFPQMTSEDELKEESYI